jgi:2-dehydro-3-deoxygluconokinase
MPDIVAFGEALVEFNQTGGEAAPTYLQGFGGDTSNCAIAAARLGASTGYVSAVGGDRFGDALIDLWRTEGVDCSQVRRDAAASTGIYFVSHDATGHHFSYYRKDSAAARQSAAGLPRDYLAAARIVHLSGISQAISASACDAGFAAIDAARQSGARVSYDTNLRLRLWPLARARAVIHAAMQRCHIALPSLDDAIQLTGLETPHAIAGFYRELGAEIVALKLGRGGALVAYEGEIIEVPGFEVNVVDATAAGDTFDGAFLSRLLRGDPPPRAARFANAAAALSTQGYGAIAPMPRQHEVEALLARGA